MMSNNAYSNSLAPTGTGSPSPSRIVSGWSTTGKSGQFQSISPNGPSQLFQGQTGVGGQMIGYSSGGQTLGYSTSGGQTLGYSTSGGQTLGYSTSGGQSYQTVQSERVVSSNIVGETLMGYLPQEDNVQYIEVPVIEEIIKRVPKKEYVEIEKRVPRYEYEWVERVVEVPQVRVVDKTVEVPQIQEIVRHVGVKQYVEVPREVVRRVPKIETKIVEREIEVPGEIIDVPKPYLVENRVIVPRYTDKEVPTVIAQRLIPIVSESETEFVDVDLKEYNPYLVPVDVYVPKPVARELIAESKTEEHRVVDVPMSQFNSLVKQLNIHIQESEYHDLFVKDQRGVVPMMPSRPFIVSPLNRSWEESHSKGTMHVSATAPATTTRSGATAAGVFTSSSGSANIMPMSGASYMMGSKYGSTLTATSRGGIFPTQQCFMPTTTTLSSSTAAYSTGGQQQYSHNLPTTYTHNLPTTSTYTHNLPTTYTHNLPSSYPGQYSQHLPTTTYTHNTSTYTHNGQPTTTTTTYSQPSSYSPPSTFTHNTPYTLNLPTYSHNLPYTRNTPSTSVPSNYKNCNVMGQPTYPSSSYCTGSEDVRAATVVTAS